MGESVKVDIIENAYMLLDDEDSIDLRVVLIESESNYYEIVVSKDMRVCYIRLAKDVIDKRKSERLQFSVHIDCRESMVNIIREHTTSNRKKGIGWFTDEEWNFRSLSYQACSWIYKLMNSLRLRLLLLSEKDKQHALETAKELEWYIELLIKTLDGEEIGEVEYCKSKNKFLVSTHTPVFE